MTIAAKELSPLALAYLGDAVYELAVRKYLLDKSPLHNKQLHKAAVELVQAQRQSELYAQILPTLDEQEQDVLRKGRNAKGGHIPAHATAGAYRRATGVEALVGWLYLEGKEQKLQQIFSLLFAGYEAELAGREEAK